MNIKFRYVSMAAAVLAASGAVLGHTLSSRADNLPNPCVTVAVDGGTLCRSEARVGVTPDMVANAQAFAACLGTQGVTPPVVLHDPLSITFTYAPGVIPSTAALNYCHANAPRIPIKPITPPNLDGSAPAPVAPAPATASTSTNRSVAPAVTQVKVAQAAVLRQFYSERSS